MHFLDNEEVVNTMSDLDSLDPLIESSESLVEIIKEFTTDSLVLREVMVKAEVIYDGAIVY